MIEILKGRRNGSEGKGDSTMGIVVGVVKGNEISLPDNIAVGVW